MLLSQISAVVAKGSILEVRLSGKHEVNANNKASFWKDRWRKTAVSATRNVVPWEGGLVRIERRRLYFLCIRIAYALMADVGVLTELNYVPKET